jgi:hypothetical protein
MQKTFTLLFLALFSCATSSAQTQKIVSDAPVYGKINIADLESKSCEFEKDANAMVLSDKAELYYDDNLNIIVERHKRVKILSDAGKKQADVRVEYYGGNRYEYITGLQGEIFNLVNGKIEITKLDKKQIFTENVDKSRMAMVFSFPNVKAGSVIEYKYKQTINSMSNLPDWYFQSDIPIRYSELITSIPEWFYFTLQQRNGQPFTKFNRSIASRSISNGSNTPLMFSQNITQYVMANVPSVVHEPFMSSEIDNMQGLYFHLTSFMPPAGFTRNFSDTWAKVGGTLADDEDFGAQLKRKLLGESAIIDKAKTLKTNDEKIAYVFNEVKNSMKWNNIDRWYTNDGTVKAWEKKIGNSTEVNLILYHLLKQSGVKAYPMVVSTREHGRVNPSYSFLYQFNRAVVYIPVDSTKRYILDATGKYNCYQETPSNLLGSYGLYIDKDNKTYDLVHLTRATPVKQVVLVNAQILPDGKMDGTASISNYSYDRFNRVENYKTNGEKKYIDYLRDNNNTLTISSLKMDNMEVDTLPLNQTIAFKQELTGSDKDYIYFSPNLFSSFRTNPFLSENRVSNIDFGHTRFYNMTGLYKLPAGYKADALPKNISLVMPDKSITCRRTVAENDGIIVIRYIINYDQPLYFKDSYPDLREFYKRMYEMLNEQVVLKKA